jgi:hypothetical protein
MIDHVHAVLLILLTRLRYTERGGFALKQRDRLGAESICWIASHPLTMESSSTRPSAESSARAKAIIERRATKITAPRGRPSSLIALRDLVAVRARPGAGAVVLHRGVPASRRSSRRRNGINGGERQGESQSDLGQHDLSPRMRSREWLLQRSNGRARQPLWRVCGDCCSFAPIDASETMRSRQRPRSLKEA